MGEAKWQEDGQASLPGSKAPLKLKYTILDSKQLACGPDLYLVSKIAE